MAPHPWRPTQHKRPRSNSTNQNELGQPEYSQSAYIQAYEAQLIYDSVDTDGQGPVPGSSRGVGSGGRDSLIRWSGESEVEGEIWADRYNILHLLPSLPTPSTGKLRSSRKTSPTPSSSSSWDDLPSDEEEIFNISGDEAIETYEREKKRKWMEGLREARMREREREDGVIEEKEALSKNVLEETLPEAIRTLMQHTAKSISASPNPKSLEMRILANHAGDSRFAFLRGKWSMEWEKVKREVRVKLGLEKVQSGMMLGDYGSDSEDEAEDDEEGVEAGDIPPMPSSPPPPPPPPPLEEEIDPDSEIGKEDSGREAEDVLVRLQKEVADEAKRDEDIEEKRRVRREKLEEWKKNKKKV